MSIPIVSEAKQKELEAKMARLGLREADIDEDFTRGSGAGGQKINKTSSVVLLTHRPSGIQVRCQSSRSQAFNRFMARRLLAEKIEEIVLREKSERIQKIEKIRRQKRKRSKRAKDKMLEGKRHRSSTKEMRRKPGRED